MPARRIRTRRREITLGLLAFAAAGLATYGFDHGGGIVPWLCVGVAVLLWAVLWRTWPGGAARGRASDRWGHYFAAAFLFAMAISLAATGDDSTNSIGATLLFGLLGAWELFRGLRA